MASKVTYSTGGLDALIDSAEGMGEAVTKELFELIVKTSPVDEGDYRDGWRMEVDQDVGLIYNTDLPIEKLRVLEEGSSNQAPRGVVRPAVQQLPDIIEDYVRKTS